MSYKDELKAAMTWLGQQPDTCVVGYNVTDPGGSGGGTFKDFPVERRHEMPLAEALMTGVATGMSLDGWVPILMIERFDFILHAADQIVNHLGKLDQLSNGIHRPAVIIRVAVGRSKTPLFTGPAHCQDFTEAFRSMVKFPVIRMKTAACISHEYFMAYEAARDERESTMLVEYADLYST